MRERRDLRRLAHATGQLAAVVVLAGVCACGTGQTARVVLPGDAKVVRPVGVSAGLSAFSGEWRGRWDTGKDSILVVERVRAGGADVVFAWAQGTRHGYWRASGTFDGETLSVVSPQSNVPFTFRVAPDGTLAGHWALFGTVTKAVFKRVAS